MKKPLDEFVFSFGRHKGMKFDDVLRESPSYIYWCARNIPWLKDRMKKEAPELYEAMKRAERALADEEEAWVYKGGRLPRFDDVFRKVYKKRGAA